MAKNGNLLPNGARKVLWQVGAIIFASGVLWAKVHAFESSIKSLENRVAAVEGILMDKE